MWQKNKVNKVKTISDSPVEGVTLEALLSLIENSVSSQQTTSNSFGEIIAQASRKAKELNYKILRKALRNRNELVREAGRKKDIELYELHANNTSFDSLFISSAISTILIHQISQVGSNKKYPWAINEDISDFISSLQQLPEHEKIENFVEPLMKEDPTFETLFKTLGYTIEQVDADWEMY